MDRSMYLHITFEHYKERIKYKCGFESLYRMFYFDRTSLLKPKGNWVLRVADSHFYKVEINKTYTEKDRTFFKDFLDFFNYKIHKKISLSIFKLNDEVVFKDIPITKFSKLYEYYTDIDNSFYLNLKWQTNVWYIDKKEINISKQENDINFFAILDDNFIL